MAKQKQQEIEIQPEHKPRKLFVFRVVNSIADSTVSVLAHDEGDARAQVELMLTDGIRLVGGNRERSVSSA